MLCGRSLVGVYFNKISYKSLKIVLPYINTICTITINFDLHISFIKCLEYLFIKNKKYLQYNYTQIFIINKHLWSVAFSFIFFSIVRCPMYTHF